MEVYNLNTGFIKMKIEYNKKSSIKPIYPKAHNEHAKTIK
jgi:hypothetical protein